MKTRFPEILLAVFAILGMFAIAQIEWSNEAELRQKPLNAGEAPWNRESRAYDIPLDNNSSTVRRAISATFAAQPIAEAPCGALVAVDQIVFFAIDRVSDFTWRKRISNIAIPANSSATINVYIVDSELAGTLLEGHLTIEFAAEENLQSVCYHMYVTVFETLDEIPDGV